MLFVEQKVSSGSVPRCISGNLVGLIVVLTTVPLVGGCWCIPFSVIAPVIIVICAIGAYTVHNAMFDVVLMLVFGVLGYLFKKLRVIAGAAGAGAGAGRHGRGQLPPGDAALAGQPGDLLVERSGGRASLALATAMLLWPLASFARKSLRRREYSPAA